MRNLLFAVLIVSMFAGCTGGESAIPVGTFAQKAPKTLENNHYTWEDQEIDGMKYRIFYKTYGTNQTGYSVFAVNLTKDKLEVELLQKQLEK